MTISDKRKEAIRAEEKFRQQVQAELPKEKSLIARKLGWLYDFLDCRPGLFLASMILLPGILWFHSNWIDNQRAAAERETYRQKIEFELEARIREHQGRLKSGDVIGFIESVNRDYVYPRLSGYKMETLFAEMSRLDIPNADVRLEAYRNARKSRDAASMCTLFMNSGWLK